jgi:hypothetical protein
MFMTREYDAMNDATRAVCDFIAHDDASTDLFRNASRHFFRSRYRSDAVDRVRHLFTNDATFADWAKRYVADRTQPRCDPAHDPGAMLRCDLVSRAIESVDWVLIERGWHDWAEGECRINGIYL